MARPAVFIIPGKGCYAEAWRCPLMPVRRPLRLHRRSPQTRRGHGPTGRGRLRKCCAGLVTVPGGAAADLRATAAVQQASTRGRADRRCAAVRRRSRWPPLWRLELDRWRGRIRAVAGMVMVDAVGIPADGLGSPALIALRARQRGAACLGAQRPATTSSHGSRMRRRYREFRRSCRPPFPAGESAPETTRWPRSIEPRHCRRVGSPPMGGQRQRPTVLFRRSSRPTTSRLIV